MREALGYALAASIWLASGAVTGRARFELWAAGFLADIATPFLVKLFHSTVPPNPVHMEDRFGTFVIIVLGEGFVGLVEGMREIAWLPRAGVIAALALVLAFAIWWVYFETLDTAPILEVKRTGRTGPYKLWVFAHLPLAAGIAAAGIGVGVDVQNAQAAELPDPQRWLLAGAIAVCFAALAILQLTYAVVGGGRESRRLALRKCLALAATLTICLLGHGLSAVAVMALLALSGAAQVAHDVWEAARARRARAVARQRVA
jgi:low temperature requirement protein LtrA